MPNNSRLRRWAIVLSEYDFEIVCTKSNQRLDVDCLSRATEDDPVDDFLENRVCLVTQFDSASWITSFNDEQSRKLLQGGYDKKGDLDLINDIIYKGDLLYVPKAKSDGLLRTTHESSWNAHPHHASLPLADNFPCSLAR